MQDLINKAHKADSINFLKKIAAKAIHDKKGRRVLDLVVTQWNPATERINIQ